MIMKCFGFLFGSLIGKVSLLALTFLIGLISIPLWFEASAPKINLCQLARNPEWYHGKIVTVEADGHSHNGSFSIDVSDCYIKHSSASIWFTEDYKPSADSQVFHRKSPTEVRTARIIVTGRFDAYREKTSCAMHWWIIHTTEMQIKSEITTETIKPPREKTPEEKKESEEAEKHFTVC